MKKFIIQENLPDSFLSSAWQYYLPLAHNLKVWSTQKRQECKGSFILGINGAQGTGKSTLAKLIAGLLREYGFGVLELSIDDFYLGKECRDRLSKEVHPLFKTRGVPGTHEVKLACEILEHLSQLDAGKLKSKLTIPRFDKASDNRRVVGESLPATRPDIIILEGWCVGALPQSESVLATPCNQLEAQEDLDGIWRNSVNQALAHEYQELFAKIDYLVMLKAPDFDSVYRWRSEQEERLKTKKLGESDTSGIMSSGQLKRFIMYYERLTHWMLEEMPERADCCYTINSEHELIAELIKPSVWKRSFTDNRLLVITDLDASLLDKNYSWDAAYESLTQLHDLNFPVIFNSSKTLAEMISLSQDFQSKLGSNAAPIVAENGGLIAFPKESEYEISVSCLDHKTILAMANDLRQEFQYQFIGFSDISAQELSELTGLSLEAASKAKQRQATEPILWQDTANKFEAFKYALEQQGVRVIQGGQFIHLMGKADKADAIDRLKQFYQNQFPSSQWLVVALGDSPNDEQMLNAADIAVLIPNRHKKSSERMNLNAPLILKPTSSATQGWHEAIQQILQSLYGI